MTSLGIDNTGDLVFSYGKEDIDFYDDTNSKEVFRVSNSRFFCKIRDVFPRELAAMYVNREDAQAWNAESLITQWDNAQAQFPEEIWRLDYERKYKRPYLGVSVDNSIPMGADKGYLIGKFFGRKKYQRRMYERNQEVYFATKYFANKARNSQIWFRGNTAPAGATIKQNYSLTITPYSDMYVCVQYTSTGTPIHERKKAGEPCTFVSDATSMDFMYIFAADYIQEIGDLSRCYIDDNSFTNGVRLRRLTIGNAQQGYNNPFMTNLAADNNPLLEYIDLRNISGLNSDLVLTSCSNLKELYAEGTNATGAIFANGGLLEVAHLPAIKSLLMKNLNYIRDLQIAGYNNLETLTIENCLNVDSYAMVNATGDKLQTLRLVGIDWILENNSILERAYLMWGLDSSNKPIDYSVLAGAVSLPTIMQYDRIKYQERWKDLVITATEIKQVPVYFKNYDGEIIDTQYVQEGHKPVDPVTSGRIDRPTKPYDAQYDYNYIGWDATFTNVAVGGTYIYTAQYESIIRKYTVKFVQPPDFNITTPLQETVDVEYGSFVSYEGDTPTYTTPEDQGAFTFYLFDKWNDIGYVDGNKTITAIYDSCTYTDGYFNNLDIDKMRPVELYMLTKLIMRNQISLSMNSDGSDYIGVEGTGINPYDEFSFTTGVDVDYGSVESVNLFPNGARTFSGTVGDYYDTGIQLLNTDRSFVLAVDYEFASDNRNGATLMQCFQTGTSDGFKLHYNSNPVITWSNSSATQCASGTNREMIIIRHKAGEKGAYVYTSNLQGVETGYIDFSNSGLRIPIIDSNLVFGSNYEPGEGYKNYAKGTVHWAKLWYNDLGESVCKDLASYIHEPVKTHLCGFRRHYLAGSSSSKSIFTFLGANSLYSTRRMSLTSNAGGWAESDLNKWLNTRFYKGLPLYMKQLIKKVTIASTIGNMSTELSTSDCYVYIPAISDIQGGMSDYENEISPGALISYIVGNNDRIRYDSSGTTPVSYWTRSPKLDAAYYYYIRPTGEPSGYGSASSTYNVVIMFSI